MNGLAVLASGVKRWKVLSAASLLDQLDFTGGFWMSFHELTSTYPWIIRRISKIKEGDANPGKAPPRRHRMAYVLGLFCPGFISGSLVPLVIVYFGFLAALAIPSFLKYKQKAVEAKAAQSSEGQQSGSGGAIAMDSKTWVNPTNGSFNALPEGFQNVARGPAKPGDPVIGAFTTNPDALYEQVILEVGQKTLSFDTYAKLLAAAKVKGDEASAHLSELKFQNIGPAQTVEFSFKRVSQGQEYENVVRGWTFDKKAFWHVISTRKPGNTQVVEDSKRLFDWLLKTTAPAIPEIPGQ